MRRLAAKVSNLTVLPKLLYKSGLVSGSQKFGLSYPVIASYATLKTIQLGVDPVDCSIVPRGNLGVTCDAKRLQQCRDLWSQSFDAG